MNYEDIGNPQMVTVARSFRRMTKRKLAEHADLNPSYITKLEYGDAPLTNRVIEKLASVLELPPGFFTQTDTVYGLPVSVSSPLYRKLQSVPQAEIKYVIALMNIYLINLRRLLDGYEFEPDQMLPEINREDYDSIEEIAATVRRGMLLLDGPIRDLDKVLERAGVILILADFGRARIDGFTMLVPDLPACIFLNRTQPPDRMRFTIAHELGHMMLQHHMQPSPEMEDEANTFASSFLMPADDILAHFPDNLKLETLYELKRYWHLSMATLLMRAHHLDRISTNHYRRLWRQMGSKGYKMREPIKLDPPPLKGSSLEQLVELNISDGVSTEDLVDKVLKIGQSDFPYMYKPNDLLRPRLKVFG